MTLRPGLGLGTFEHAGVEEIWAKQGKAQGLATAKQKKEEYLRQRVNNAKEVKMKKRESQSHNGRERGLVDSHL